MFSLAALPLIARTPVRDYALVLEEAPAAVRTGQAAPRVRAAQTRVRAELARRGVRVTGAADLLVNAVFVSCTRAEAEALRGLPGVARVEYVPPIHMNLDTALDLVNAQGAWSAAGGAANAGAGVKIGIIDSGIDHTHPGFQDASLTPPAGFPKGDAAYTNSKVIVARSYVAELAGSDPKWSKPDDTTPRDRSGHGTAVAMIAAGVRNTGPLATITGMAPKAFLGNYKVFGSPGVNDTTRGTVLIQALEDAYRDGMDIVTLALGDPAVYGPLDTGCEGGQCDIRAQAVESAVKNGMAVVVSAGNNGDSGLEFPALNTINTPGSAPSAITVGASTNAHMLFSTVRVPGREFDAAFGDGPKAPVTAAVRDVGTACSAIGGSLGGAIALIRRGECFFVDKVLNAQNAGASGVIIYNTSSEIPFAPEGLGSSNIPTVMVGAAAGAALQATSAAVTIDPALRAVPDTPNVAAGFSSQGPNIGNFGVKPELVAPGTDIYTATQDLDPNSGMWDSTRYTGVSSTSFAVPMVAGAAAIVKQRNAGFTPAQIKSAVVNTAGADVTGENGQARVTAVGAGKLNAQAAAGVTATIEPSTISFGNVGTGTLPVSVSLRVTNTGGSAAAFNIGVTQRDQDNNARVTVSPSSLQLGAGQNGTVTVRLEGTRPRAGLYEGAITVNNLRVPYLYVAGDGIAYNIFPVINGVFTGVPGDQDWLIAFKLVDRYGVPVINAPVQFRAQSGGGAIAQGDAVTDVLGIAGAFVDLGNTLGDQIFTATAGGLTVEFDGFARPYPTISAGAVLNAASGQVGSGLAPGSYASIFGSGLSDSAVTLKSASLPFAMAGVSVSFDAAGISVPGRLSYASPQQINVQIPWELRDQRSVQLKVSVGDIQSALYTLPLNNYSPAAFEYDAGGQRLTAALDYPANSLITESNAARRGQVIQIFANGLGPVSNQPPSGEPSPVSPLAQTTTTPTVTIGGRPAAVLFSGLAPRFVGLYQVNVTVPQDAPTGIQPLVISIGGVASKAANLPVN